MRTSRVTLRRSLSGMAGALATTVLASFPAIATTTDATPELRNSPKLVTPERVKTDPFNGTAAYAYKIDVPPGTAGMTPELVLTYNTQTQHSEYGYGWSLNFPYIERSTREHRPYYNDPGTAPQGTDDEFELGGDLLVREGTSNRFDLRYADGSRILWIPGSGAHWEVTKPDGTKMLFGTGLHSRIYRNSDTPAETFRWSLSEVIDPRGNSYRIEYWNDHDVAGAGSAVVIPYETYVYPSTITYTHTTQSGAAPLQDRRTIHFKWQERANPGESDTNNHICDGKEDCPTSYRAGFKVQRRYRLARIGVGIDANGDGLDASEEVRSYDFLYTNKTSNEEPKNPPFSQLAAIQRHGTGGLPFPSASNPVATEFDYTRQDRRFNSPDSHGLPDHAGGEWSATPGQISAGPPNLDYNLDWLDRNVIDMNGDGVMDRVEVVGTLSQHSWRVYLGLVDENGPHGFDLEHPLTWTFDCSGPGSGELMCAAAKSEHLQNAIQSREDSDLVDMNGDLKPDRVVAGTSGLIVYLNTGSGFGPAQTWSLLPGSHGSPTYITESYPITGGGTFPAYFRLPADINGDGRPEYFQDLAFQVNTGAGFGPQKSAPMAMSGDPGGFNFNEVAGGITEQMNELIDVNGDGIADFIPAAVCFATPDWVEFGLGYAEADAQWRDMRGQGHSYSAFAQCPDDGSNVWAESHFDWYAFESLIDMNGDGIRDYVSSNAFNGRWIVYFGLGDGRFLVTAATGGPSPIGPVANGVTWDMSNVTNCDPGDVGYQDISVTWPGNSIARTIDLDGDGLVDYVRTRAENPNFLDCRPGPLPANWTVWRNPGPEGLLSQVTNELGGTTKIEYKPSNWMKSLQEVPETPAPPSDIVRDGRPRWVVTKVEVKDGRAGTATESESMAYAGFRFDQVRRESFGVRTAQDADAEGLVTQSVFHQVPEKRGKLEHQQKCKGGTCFEQMDTQWDVIHEPVPDKSFLVRPTLTTTTVHACAEGSPPGGCSASDAAQVRVVQRTFEPDTGLLKSETDAGADAVLGTTDDLVHTLSYAKNTDEWIVSTVFEDSLYAGTVGSANLISQSRLYYDAAAAGGGTPTTPQRCTGGSGLCGALVSFRETLRDLSTTWAVEHWTYDSAGNMTQYFDPKAVAAAGGATQTVAYDTGEHNAFPVSIWNALSHESQFRFDATLGEVTKALTPGGHLRCFDYDDFGRLSARSELGTSTDSIDSTCDTPLASFAFENLGDPESQHITESLYPNATTALQSLRYFDGLGREYQNESMHKASDGSFDVVTRAFGDRGELACETLPFRRTGGLAGSSPVSCFAQTPRRETSYDPVLRLVQVDRVEPGGGRVTEVTSAYAINGFSLTSSVGALLVERRTTTGGPGAGSQAPTPDRIQAFGRDNRGQVVALWDGDNPNAVTRLDRDAKGRIIRVDGPDVALASGGSDPNLLEIAYNAVDQRTRIAQPMTPGEQTSAPRWLFTYDLDGDLYEQTSPRNVTIRFHHDVLRRLVLEDFAPLTTNPATPGAGDIVHEYWSSTSGIDLPKAVYGRHGIRDDFAYDWRGRLANKTRTYWGSMQFAFGYSYDWLDRPSITVMPDASSISYTYDGAQLTQAFSAVWLAGNILTVDAVVSGIDAHPSGGLTNLIFASPAFPTQPGVQSTYSYGPGDHRLASATTVRAGSLAPLQQLLYTYDTAGNLRRSDDVQGALDQDFAYDLFHRLAEVDTGPLSYGTETYQYDDAGNILFKGPADAQGQLRLLYDRTASQPTHLATVDQRQAGGGWTPGAGSYAINQDGGVTQRTKGSQVLNLWRNAEGMAQLISDSSVPQTSVTYHYDATGRRSEKLVTGAWGTVSADRYSVDASFEVDTVNVTHEVHLFVGGRRVATSERTGFGNGVLPESLLSVTTYHPDQVGTNTVTVRTTATGQTVSTTVLDPFGQKKSGAGPEPRHLFTDQERDAETGLDYFGARYYDSWVGRFIEEDPELIGSSVGGTFARIGVDAANLNGYAYALNRPTTVTDPTGADAEGSGGAPDLDAIQGSGSEGSGSEEGDHCGVSCDFPDPDDRLPRPDGESNDPRGKGLPISLPPVQRASQIESAGTQYAALIVRPDGSVPGADQKLLIFPLPEVPGGLAVPSSRVLGEALEAAGISRPAASAAHHIVAGRAAAAAAARAVLEKFGIGINDAANGVFLPRSAASAADAAVHAGGHKDLYYQAVNQALSAATTKEQAIKILNSIGQALQEGAFPW